jgi:hypothetical protein
MNSLKPYAKAIVPLVIGFVVTILQAFAAEGVNRATVVSALVTLLTSVSVYLTPNTPKPVPAAKR